MQSSHLIFTAIAEGFVEFYGFQFKTECCHILYIIIGTRHHGSILLMIFEPQFKFDGNFSLFSINFELNYCFIVAILLDWDGNIVNEMGPVPDSLQQT